MIMRVSLMMEGNRSQARVLVHGALIALCKTWAAYTVKRAIADVASTSKRDYREFGLDKAELLAALEQLQSAIESDQMPPATHRNDSRPRLAIAVKKREPKLIGTP
jgi:hypothetical protein